MKEKDIVARLECLKQLLKDRLALNNQVIEKTGAEQTQFNAGCVKAYTLAIRELNSIIDSVKEKKDLSPLLELYLSTKQKEQGGKRAWQQ